MSPHLNQLRALANSLNATEMAAYHKAERPYLGLSLPQIEALVSEWRATLDVPERVALADTLWQSDIHEARIAAAKLLTQARIKDDAAVWALIASWVPDFDTWALADHACKAGEKRLTADPSRLDQVEEWLTSDNMWTRRAALVMTLPWTKQNHPKPADEATRDRVLGWMVMLAPDRDWFIQKTIARWLRDLSKHDAPRTHTWLDAHGESLKSFARKEAAKYL
ncbi:DNA alkylation repair protein [Phaeovulum sp.]|uniref:DNA alkylation repair protein n=1 Tax=Phaeovulum sp. TaxID=2934796 RepID=UPI0039E6AB73